MKLRILFILFFTICFSLSPTFSQAFLNGDFEINSCPGGEDQINLANAGYNGYMSNSFAFGTYGDMDILTTPTYWLPQSGSLYIAFTGGGVIDGGGRKFIDQNLPYIYRMKQQLQPTQLATRSAGVATPKTSFSALAPHQARTGRLRR